MDIATVSSLIGETLTSLLLAVQRGACDLLVSITVMCRVDNARSRDSLFSSHVDGTGSKR